MPPEPDPLPLSVAIVCRNNGRTIGATLHSVISLASEIVAVDSGSSDETIPLLERHGARIIRSEWLGHVKTKQLALDHCTKDWVLCLDSDEVVLPELAASIRATIQKNDVAIGGCTLNRKTYYRSRPLNHAWQPEPRLRLVRRGRARWAGLDPHDYLELIQTAGGPGWTGTLSGDLRHDSFETFAEHLRKQWDHSRVMAQSLHAAGKRGSYAALLVSPAAAMLKQLVLKGAFLDGAPGWLAAASTAAGALMKHAMLIELGHGGTGLPAGDRPASDQ